MNVATNTVFFDKLTYIYLEMPKFNKTEAELETQYDKWLFVLKNLHLLTSRPKKLQEEVFKQLFEQSEIAQLDEQEYQNYEASLKHYRDLKNSLDTAYDDGLEEGLEKGIEQGIEQGLIQTAKNLKDLDASKEMISKATGLDDAEIEQL